MTVQVEGETVKDLFHQFAVIDEILGQYKCGKCGSENLKFVVRKATDKSGKKEYLYYELHCRDCGAKFKFGVGNDSGELFPKPFKQDENGEDIRDDNGRKVWAGGAESKGWTKYNFETGEEE